MELTFDKWYEKHSSLRYTEARAIYAELQDVEEAVWRKWEIRLSPLMPRDFKDWHDNSREDHPEIVAAMISSYRQELDQLYRTLNPQIEQPEGNKGSNLGLAVLSLIKHSALEMQKGDSRKEGV